MKPKRGQDGDQYVWVGYERKSPHLPIAVADSIDELADLMHTTKNAIRSSICHSHDHSIYQKVKIL